MMSTFVLRFLIYLILNVFYTSAAHLPRIATVSPSQLGFCRPYHTTFSDPSEIIHHSEKSSGSNPFVVTSEAGSYKLGKDGLEMYLEEPDCAVSTQGNVNDIIGDGATVNSTFTLLYGKVTFEVSAPAVAGVVSAAILIADESDEIDVELVGGDSGAWQTNVFTPNPQDKEPLWGVFGTVETLSHSSKVDYFHKYTIDWNPERIEWSVDGNVVRTLTEGQTRKNGTNHYPTHPTRIQMGIWDASTPEGTSEWAHGPIDWTKAPQKMTAYVKSITVECPYS